MQASATDMHHSWIIWYYTIEKIDNLRHDTLLEVYFNVNKRLLFSFNVTPTHSLSFIEIFTFFNTHNQANQSVLLVLEFKTYQLFRKKSVFTRTKICYL